ncbi:MAG: PIG-L family deacetylase, partial [Isosphaeraceae bacterium]|nr:PIG-L family deacetylase [Isosphaeraceae bacterium]
MSGLPRRVLALGAHPDDIELLCAGTLARYLAAGTEVHLAIACLGNRGGRDGPDAELARVRCKESQRAAETLGAPVTFLGIGDAEVRDTPEIRRSFLDLFRSIRPELVLTHGPTDYHDDHVQVGALAAKCAWYAASSGHRTEQPPLEHPPALVYLDNLAGCLLKTNE